MTSDLSTSDSTRSSTSSGRSGSAPHTASAAGRSKPPTKTPSRSNRSFSLSDRRSYDHATSARSVCWRSSSTRPPPVKQREPVVQPLVDFLDRQRAHPRRRELQRERNALDPRAELGDGRRFALGQREAGLLQLRARHEQLDGFRARQRLDARGGLGQRERQHRIDLLARDAQRFAARRDDPDVGRRAQQRVGKRCAGAHHLLAVVEDQQRLPRLQMRAQRVRERLARLLAHGEHLRRLVRDERRIADRREVQEPDAVGIRVEHVGGDLQRQPRLAETAHAEQRQQAVALEELSGLLELALASDERGELLRQVVGRGFERAQRREVRPQVGMQDLVDVLRGRQVLQPDAAEIAQRGRRGQACADLVDDRLRHQDLAAVRHAHDPRGAIDGRAEVVVVAPLDDAHVQPAAHADRRCRW